MTIFIIAPLIMVVWFAVFVQTPDGYVFSLEGLQKCFDPLYLRILIFSLYIALISTGLCLIIGYPLAFILSGPIFKKKNKGIMLFLLIAPMWMNFLLRTYAWLTILETNGLLNTVLKFFGFEPVQFLYTQGAVIMGMVYNFLPFMVLPIYNVLLKLDPYVLAAADDLGASKAFRFRKIILPLSMPGVVSGIIMVYMPAVTTFVITRLLGGGQYEMIGNVIEQQFLVANYWSFGSSLSVLLMAMILLCVAFVNKASFASDEGILF